MSDRRRDEVERRLEDSDDDFLQPGGALMGRLWQELSEELDPEKPPPLQPGQRIGRFEIRGVLGVGGMGQVYRAHHPELGRDVAIKALPESFGADSERSRRFGREARLLASLSHPNIATLHDLLVVDGRPYLVLELVEGEDLRAHLGGGALPVGEAVSLARQLAHALGEAHGKGIVHRDLKPGNLMISPKGHLKILDFGIAKTDPGLLTGDPDESSLVTHAGAVLGTVAYMSPEQASGEPVDRRLDIWAFGCVLFEMLTGQRAFDRGGDVDTLGAVLRDDPDWSLLPDSTPPSLRHLLELCLRKDPRHRLQDIGDARITLEEVAGGGERAPLSWPEGRQRQIPWSLVIAAGALALLLLGLASLLRLSAHDPQPVRVLTLLPEPGVELADHYDTTFDIAPDGRTVIYLGSDRTRTRIFSRPLDRLEATLLEGTDGAFQPFFSADGRSVAFFAGRKLHRLSLEDGLVEELWESGGAPRGADWGSNGEIVIAPSQTSGLVLLDPGGGAPRPLTELDVAAGESSHRWPAFTPDGEWVLFTRAEEGASFDDARLEAVRVADGRRHVVEERAAHGRAVGDRLVFANQGRLWVAPFDPARARTTGERLLFVDGVSWDRRNAGAQFAVHPDLLLYRPGVPSDDEMHLAWRRIDGTWEVIDRPRRYREPRLSPDRRRAAVAIGPPAAADLWLVDLESDTLSRLTREVPVHRPIWSPDGARIAFSTPIAGGWSLMSVDVELSRQTDGTAPITTLLRSDWRLYPGAWSADGRSLILQARRADTGWDLLRWIDAAGTERTEPLRSTAANETNPAPSPDGRWLAWESDELDNVVQVYVASLSNPAARTQVSETGGRWPVWGDDLALYYWETGNQGKLRRIELGLEASPPTVVRSQVVLCGGLSDQPCEIAHDDELLPTVSPSWAGFGVDSDRDRWLFLAAPPTEDPRQPGGIVVLEGWSARSDLR